MASKAWSGVKYIYGLVNSEKYKHDISSSANPDTSGTIIPLTSIAVGDTDATRTGNAIYVRSVLCNMVVQIHASATNTTYRYMIIRDKQQAEDTSPSIGSVLDTVGVHTPLNSATVGRFDILKDMTYNINTVGTPTRIHKVYLPMRSHVRYNNTASTDITKNGLYLILISNEATNVPSVTYFVRVSYHDN